MESLNESEVVSISCFLKQRMCAVDSTENWILFACILPFDNVIDCYDVIFAFLIPHKIMHGSLFANV